MDDFQHVSAVHAEKLIQKLAIHLGAETRLCAHVTRTSTFARNNVALKILAAQCDVQHRLYG